MVNFHLTDMKIDDSKIMSHLTMNTDFIIHHHMEYKLLTIHYYVEAETQLMFSLIDQHLPGTVNEYWLEILRELDLFQK